jgi:3',5'-cyclic AMP phosphodiesterase CpdA
MDKWPNKITIAQITDLHEPYGATNVARFVYEVNLLRPDMVITTGDNVDVETISSAWGYLQDSMNRLEIPSYFVPGNHDYAGSHSSLYQKYGGSLNYTIVIGNFVIIALDSGEEGYLQMDQIRYAESVLKLYPNKVKILAFHHPPLSRDVGTHQTIDNGGIVTSDWTKISELTDLMHLNWLTMNSSGKYTPIPEMIQLIRIIQENDVRLILNGHVHSDVIHILNGRHWFVTSAAIGGGVTPPMRQGYRMVTVNDNGTVTLDPIGKARLTDPPNNIPIGKIKYWFEGRNDGSKKIVVGVIQNDHDFPLDAQLEYVVNASVPLSEYKWSGTSAKKVDSLSINGVYILRASFSVPSQTVIYATVSAEDDLVKPEANIRLPDTYSKGDQIPIRLEVSDTGSGVKSVEVNYAFEQDSRWWPLEVPFTVNVDKDNNVLEYPTEVYDLKIESRGYELNIKVDVIDYFGNRNTISRTVKAIPPPKNKFTITINSEPNGVQASLNGTVITIPYTSSLDEGNYNITLHESVKIAGKSYTFKSWSDGSTSRSRIINLNTDKTYTLDYSLVTEGTSPPPTQNQPSGGIPLPIEFAIIGLILGSALVYIKRWRT